MFPVILKKQVHSCFAAASSNDVLLEYRCVLPFAPFIGLRLRFGRRQEAEEPIELKADAEIYWDGVRFEVWVEADKELYNEGLRSGLLGAFQKDFTRRDEIVAGYVQQGWRVSKW